jgi:hypothetical protein
MIWNRVMNNFCQHKLVLVRYQWKNRKVCAEPRAWVRLIPSCRFTLGVLTCRSRSTKWQWSITEILFRTFPYIYLQWIPKINRVYKVKEVANRPYLSSFSRDGNCHSTPFIFCWISSYLLKNWINLWRRELKYESCGIWVEQAISFFESQVQYLRKDWYFQIIIAQKCKLFLQNKYVSQNWNDALSVNSLQLLAWAVPTLKKAMGNTFLRRIVFLRWRSPHNIRTFWKYKLISGKRHEIKSYC